MLPHIYHIKNIYIYIIYIYIYIYIVNRMIPVPDVIQPVFGIPCVLRLPAFQWRATEARLIFLVMGHLSQHCVGE